MIVLKNKEFARRDYEGLTEENAAKLKAKRAELAKEFRNNKQNNKMMFGIWGEPAKERIANTQDLNFAKRDANKFRQDLLNQQASSTPKPSIKTGNINSAFHKPSQGFGKTAMEFAKKNKAAIGIGAGLGVAVGGYEMYKNKKKNKN